MGDFSRVVTPPREIWKSSHHTSPLTSITVFWSRVTYAVSIVLRASRPSPPLILRSALPGRPAAMARVYADVNQQMPRSYWDYDSVNITWEVLGSLPGHQCYQLPGVRYQGAEAGQEEEDKERNQDLAEPLRRTEYYRSAGCR